MARARQAPYQTPPVQLLLSSLHTLSTIPHERKVEAMRSTAEHYRSMHRSMGLPEPSWIALLDYAADLEQERPTEHEAELRIPESLPDR